MTPSRALPVLVLLASAALLGVAPILVRVSDAGPTATAFWRFAFALPLLLVLTWRVEGGLGRPNRWMALAGLFFALDFTFWHYSIGMTSVANATALCNLTPIVVTLFAWLVLRQRPKALFLLALGVAVVGAFGMAAGASGDQGTDPALGDLFALLVSVWYAGIFLSVGEARKTAGALRVTLWASVVGLPILLIVSLALGETLLPKTGGGWGAVAALGLVHVAGQGGIAWALGRLPASLTSVTALIQPVIAAVLGWALFAETMTAIQIGGGLLVLTAVLLAQWSARTKTGAEPQGPAPA